MVGRMLRQDKPEVWFAPPLWKEEDDRRQAIEERLPPGHLARRIDAGVDRLDLEPLIESYAGRGTAPLRPDLMLKLVSRPRGIFG